MNAKYKSKFDALYVTLSKMTDSESSSKRMYYYVETCRLIEDIEEDFEKMTAAYDTITSTTASAAISLQELSDWIEYLYIAMGENKEMYMNIATCEKKAVQSYIDKHRKHTSEVDDDEIVRED